MGASGKNRLSLLENEQVLAFCEFGRDFMGFRGQITGDIFGINFIKKCVFMEQIHSNLVQIYDAKCDFYECDGLVSDKKGIALCVLSADCLPLLLWHKKGFVAALHSGRKGSFENILKNAVGTVKSLDESVKNEDFTLIIAPGICAKNYEISGDILDFVRKNFSEFLEADLDFGRANFGGILDANLGEKSMLNLSENSSSNLSKNSLPNLSKNSPLNLSENSPKNRLNLKALIKKQAENLGIKNVLDAGICTFEDTRFFSYRRDKTKARFVSVVVLK